MFLSILRISKELFWFYFAWNHISLLEEFKLEYWFRKKGQFGNSSQPRSMQRSRYQLLCKCMTVICRQASRWHQGCITPQPQTPFTLICFSLWGMKFFLNQGPVIFMNSDTLKSKVPLFSACDSGIEMPSPWLSSKWRSAKIRRRQLTNGI